MKIILVPTDFSDASTNALTYALELNRRWNAAIVLMHSYLVPIPTSEAAIVVPDKALKESDLKTLEEIKVKFKKMYPGVVITAHLTEGFPDIEILSAEKQLNADAVVMGTHGLNILKRLLVGTTTSKVIGKSVCPLIAVPENAKYRHLNKIVFAANYGVDDFSNVYDLISLIKPFNSEVILLHVSSEKSDQAFDYNQLDNFKNHISSETGYSKITFKLLEGAETYDGLNNYLEEINADMFAISMRNRSFLQSIFRPGLTKKMIYHSRIPVIVFHTDEG